MVTPIYRLYGKLMRKPNGKIAHHANCCCCNCDWFEMPSDTQEFGSWDVSKNGGAFGGAADTDELVDYPGAWCPGEDWISTVVSNNEANNGPGLDDDLDTLYTYRVKFNIVHPDGPSCLRLLGLYSADNFCDEMRVNGNAVPAAPAVPSYCKYGSTSNWQFSVQTGQNPKSDFVIEASSGWWAFGENVLEWDVHNNSNDEEVLTSPTGFWCAFYQCVDNSINSPNCF